jgi:hydrogenase maturation factor
MFCDAQTSGGLLASIPKEFADEVLHELTMQGISSAAAIGRITEAGEGIITVI